MASFHGTDCNPFAGTGSTEVHATQEICLTTLNNSGLVFVPKTPATEKLWKEQVHMEKLTHIQNYLDGKTDKEVEEAVVSGRISFDGKKYRLMVSDAKMSGYVADFTEQYKTIMQEILGRGVFAPGVYVKLDDILADGYEFERTDETELYVSGRDIFRGTGKSPVTIYRFRDGDNTRELLVSRGDIVKGSLAMAERTSSYLESKYEDLAERQEYVCDVMGVSRALASHVTTSLRSLDDETFDMTVDHLFAFSRQVMERLSIRHGGRQGFRYAFTIQPDKGDAEGYKKIVDTLFHFVGSNAEMLKMLKMLVNGGTARRTEDRGINEHAVKMTREIIISAMRKEIRDIISEENIATYRNFVSSLGQYDDGYTQDILSVAEITGTEGDLLKFVMQHGGESDFMRLMTSTFYDTESKKCRNMSLPETMLRNIYESMKVTGRTALPIGIKGALNVYNAVSGSGLKKNARKRCYEAFEEMLCRKNRIRYNFLSFAKGILKDTSTTTSVKEELLVLSMECETRQDLVAVLSEKHPLMKTSPEKFAAVADALSAGECVADALRVGFGECTINKGMIDIAGNIYGVECRKSVPIPGYLAERIEAMESERQFLEKCGMMLGEIAGMGITGQYEKYGIKADIHDTGYGCTVSFGDGKTSAELEMGDPAYMSYVENAGLRKVADNVRNLYRRVMEISSESNEADSCGKIAELFDIKRLFQYSPDQILVWNINGEEKARLGSTKKSSVAEYLIGNGGRSIRVSELAELQSAVRKAYTYMHSYDDMLLSSGIPSMLFSPCVYSVETESFTSLPDAACDSAGNVYVGVEKLFHLDSMSEFMERLKKDETESAKTAEAYAGLEEYDPEMLWNKKIQFIEDCVESHCVTRRDLFGMIHSLSLGEDGIPWVRELLDGIDGDAASDYREYEKRLGAGKNPAMARI